MNNLLSIEALTVKNASRCIVNNVSLEVPPGKIISLLGANGAGKSELVLAIAGVIPSTGIVKLGRTDLSNLDAQAVRAEGISIVPEGHHVLAGLNVLDNLQAAGPMLSKDVLNQEVENAFFVFPELKKHLGDKAGSLSGGQQQMLAIAQALISRPKFLLLDEMSLGLAPVIIERLVSVVHELRSRGLGILLIEQFTQLALSMADHCYVMSQGAIQFSGLPETLKSNPEILEKAYFG